MKITSREQLKDGMIVKHTFFASDICNNCELKVFINEKPYTVMTDKSFCVTKDGQREGQLCHAMNFNNKNYMYDTIEDEVTGFLSIGSL